MPSDERKDIETPDSSGSYRMEYIAQFIGDPTWEAIWSVIRKWDISRLNDGLYSGATGDDATAIFDAIRALPTPPAPDVTEADFAHMWQSLGSWVGGVARPDADMAPTTEFVALLKRIEAAAMRGGAK